MDPYHDLPRSQLNRPKFSPSDWRCERDCANSPVEWDGVSRYSYYPLRHEYDPPSVSHRESCLTGYPVHLSEAQLDAIEAGPSLHFPPPL